MMITLDDMQQILGIHVEGSCFNSVKGAADIKRKDVMKMAAEGLGVNEKDAVDECDKAFAVRKPWIKEKSWLRATVNSSDEELDKCVIGYILYLLGTVILPDKTKNKIYVYYLWGLKEMNKIGEIGWGTTILAHTYCQLRFASWSGVNGYWMFDYPSGTMIPSYPIVYASM